MYVRQYPVCIYGLLGRVFYQMQDAIRDIHPASFETRPWTSLRRISKFPASNEKLCMGKRHCRADVESIEEDKAGTMPNWLRCIMDGARFCDLNADCMKLKKCTFTHAVLTRMNCVHAVFEGCDFRGAELIDVTCRDAKFHDCDFRGAVFRRCDFSEAEFHQCDFTETRFFKCVFRNATFKLSSSYVQMGTVVSSTSRAELTTSHGSKPVVGICTMPVGTKNT